jgi:hypothetical protein
MEQESGSLRWIRELVVGGLALIFWGFVSARGSWPDQGDLFWKLGHTAGQMNEVQGVLVGAGVLCLVIAAGLQITRLLFRLAR